MTVFDLWALSNYMKMQADEQYVNAMTVSKMKDAALRPSPILTAREMPKGN